MRGKTAGAPSLSERIGTPHGCLNLRHILRACNDGRCGGLHSVICIEKPPAAKEAGDATATRPSQRLQIADYVNNLRPRLRAEVGGAVPFGRESVVADVLDAYAGSCQQPLRYRLFENAADMLRAAGTERFTHYLLDVMMPGMDGMTAAQEIRAFDPDARLVFLTSFSEYAYRSYRVRAYDYLLKPVREQTLTELLDRMQAEEAEAEACVAIQNGRSIFRIPYARLACLQLRGVDGVWLMYPLIVQRRRGDCSFEACDGIFVLRMALPL